ncbi:MAG TPA: ABC transporter ATP-binding protein [Methanothrix sp.]|nr:ABC transporter ATP-binding protein [Methanothrix sp.]HOV82396.1 ABC transporter ATP-binding protein [Methanothrix sp.]HPC89159.1 ABC transporter ATP-binding protein [Methanothrix sp.]HQE87896.1 ABC transporter ATP-binding protein [Methanothrix sp.]HQI67552.1 ABC transporter ATP-binding protein [Methanothrix sp.]
MTLTIRNLRVSAAFLEPGLAKRERPEILCGVEMSLERGCCLALIGESGAGKSTLGLSIMGLFPGSASGEIIFQGRNMLRLSQEKLRQMRGRDMAMVFQNVEGALDPVQRIADQVAEAAAVHRSISSRAAGSMALQHLLSMGLSEDKARLYPHQISGGEKQRALIAMATINDPDLLILDEPTASLDALTKSDITRRLASCISGRICILITHDLSLARALADRMAVLYSGRIMEMGAAKDLLENPLHPYTRGLVRSYPDMTVTKDLQGIAGRMEQSVPGCPFHRRCTQKIEVCSREVPNPRRIERGDRVLACHRGGIIPLLEVRGLSVSYGSSPILQDINLTLYEGETVAVVGESGSGKSTLARAIMGLCRPARGSIILEGRHVQSWDGDFYSRVQMVFQNPGESVSHRMNVLEAVSEPLVVQRRGRSGEMLPLARGALRQAELPCDDDFLKRYPHELSGGEVQRVAIARALVLRPRLLLADEPTSALDPSVQAKILKLLMSLQERMGLGLLFITHDIAVARKISDRIAVMRKGRIVEEGPAPDVLLNPRHSYTRRLVESASACGRDGLHLYKHFQTLPVASTGSCQEACQAGYIPATGRSPTATETIAR